MPEDYYLDKQQREYLLKDLATPVSYTHLTLPTKA